PLALPLSYRGSAAACRIYGGRLRIRWGRSKPALRRRQALPAPRRTCARAPAASEAAGPAPHPSKPAISTLLCLPFLRKRNGSDRGPLFGFGDDAKGRKMANQGLIGDLLLISVFALFCAIIAGLL